jgi:hypothetical protein
MRALLARDKAPGCLVWLLCALCDTKEQPARVSVYLQLIAYLQISMSNALGGAGAENNWKSVCQSAQHTRNTRHTSYLQDRLDCTDTLRSAY